MLHNIETNVNYVNHFFLHVRIKYKFVFYLKVEKGLILDLLILKSHSMTENIYIKLLVLILQKGKKTMLLLASLASFFVVISIEFVQDCNRLLSLLTPQSLTFITLQNKYRLSVRFSHLNTQRMMQFSFTNSQYKSFSSNRAAEACYCHAAYSAYLQTNILSNFK